MPSLHDTHVRNLDSRRVQCDEIWSFCYSKQKNVASAKAAPADAGDTWTWTAIDADSKLAVSWLVGGRDAGYATEFMNDVAERLANRVQLTTDGHRAYLEAVEGAFGADVDYAQLIKIYGAASEGEKRYSPADCTGIRLNTVTGNPDAAHISTSYVERQNLTMRMSMRRFTRAHQRFFKEGRKPCPRRCASLHALQLLPDSPNPTSYPRDGKLALRIGCGTYRISWS